MNRRTFTKTLLAGVGAAAFPALPEAQAQKRLKIGITMLIWGAVPRTPENLEPALKDCERARLPHVRNLRLDSRRPRQEGHAGGAARKVSDSVEVGVRHRERHGSSAAEGANRHAAAVRQDREEVRRQLSRAVGQWTADRLRVRRAQSEHHRGAQRLRQGGYRHGPAARVCTSTPARPSKRAKRPTM